MENNSVENIFLGKLELMLTKLNELDSLTAEISEIIKEQPNKQQQIDWKLSDYYHKLEDLTTTDTEFINIGREIQKARLIRADYTRTYEIIKCYNENKDKLFWSPIHNREEFRKAIKYAIKYLHEDYKYRVLTDIEIKDLKKVSKEKVIKVNNKLTKEKLEECLANGMKNKDIAAAFKVDDSYVSKLKKKYGLNRRIYTKRG